MFAEVSKCQLSPSAIYREANNTYPVLPSTSNFEIQISEESEYLFNVPSSRPINANIIHERDQTADSGRVKP